MSIAVVGGGVSGLSFALRASRLTSSKLTVYETRSKCGGWVEARVGKILELTFFSEFESLNFFRNHNL